MLTSDPQNLAATFKAADGSLALAISGTGTSGMEAAVATLTRPGTRDVAVVTGYFGDRLAQMLQRYGASVTRVDVEWGRACDPARLEAALGEYKAASEYDPSNRTASSKIAELDRVIRDRIEASRPRPAIRRKTFS